MRLISCQDGKLVRVDSAALAEGCADGFSTGLQAFDRLLPGGRLARGAVHEILTLPKAPRGMFIAGWLAETTLRGSVASSLRHLFPQTLIWSDPLGELYPPGLVSLGISLDRLLVLRPANLEEEVWGVAECLACRGVGATVAVLPELTRLQARRLQLAAERGGGIGLLLRRWRPGQEHAAATRWLVEPARGERTVQRWKLQLIHGHGGRLGEVVYLEYCRETHCVRAAGELVGGSKKTKLVAAG